jgi:DNA excision repair protein ERCC-3
MKRKGSDVCAKIEKLKNEEQKNRHRRFFYFFPHEKPIGINTRGSQFHLGGPVLSIGKPLIVQSDLTLLLDVNNPSSDECRERILAFAELVKSPEHVHTYRISRLSLWNASTAGYTAEQVLEALRTFSRYPIPVHAQTYILHETAKYGRLILEKKQNALVLTGDPSLLEEIDRLPSIQPFVLRKNSQELLIHETMRGSLKQTLAKFGFPVKDRVGYTDGDPLPIDLRELTASGRRFSLRPYQTEAVKAFLAGDNEGASGIVVLPCGAGKTVIGLAAMAKLQTQTLILTPNLAAAHQWKSEILDKCDIPSGSIGEYTSEQKEVKPVTVATYQMLTYTRDGKFPHFDKLNQNRWGFIIYDEVHLLPAPVFRITAELQSTRRLGLTATLVREDGAETEVFSLIGPKKFDIPWKQLEQKGWIAETACYEVGVHFDEPSRRRYVEATERQKYRIAAENPNKMRVIRSLLRLHANDQVLIIGQYIEQLKLVANDLQVPLITGQTPMRKREELYEKFRKREISILVVSKVANIAIDLPDANVAIQISGAFGSRQEEAQRLGRLLRPNRDQSQSRFYSIVTSDSLEQEKAMHRQLFLIEQGYEYAWLEADELLEARSVLHEIE